MKKEWLSTSANGPETETETMSVAMLLEESQEWSESCGSWT